MKRFLCPVTTFENGFQYPQSFLNVIDEDDLIDLEPWWFLCEFEGYSQQWFDEIKKLYPERNLIPFAKKSDSDDVACFDGHSTSGDPKVYYVHAFASPGWEDHGTAANFNAWFASAENESVVYKSGQRT